MAGWHCDGIPKDGKKYTHSKSHEPHLNYGLDCEICGLPQQAMISKTSIINFNYAPYKIILGIAVVIFILGGGVYLISLIIQNSCSQGMEKVEGKCIDPYLETYELGIQDGEKALKIINDYRTVEELKQAQAYLNLSINKLSKIPESALVYPEAKAKINNYDNLSRQIAKVINNFQLCAIEPKPDACLF
jgi:branched-chain amino acid transport system substrate-binding protein